MNALAAFSRVVTDATSQLGESDFAQVLSNGIRELIAADDTSLIRYLDAGPPVIEYTLPTKRRGKTILNRYVKGPFLLDPFYRAAEGRRALWRIPTEYAGPQRIQGERVLSNLVPRVQLSGRVWVADQTQQRLY
jgi:hypothetical protein